MARSKLTPKVSDAICDAVRAGNYADAAASAGGVSKSTMYGWLSRGKDEQAWIDEGHPPRKAESVYLDFLDAFTRAEDAAEREAVGIWRDQMPNDWRAAKEFLARRHSERWGDRQRMELTGKDGGPVKQEVSTSLSREQARDILRELREGTPAE